VLRLNFTIWLHTQRSQVHYIPRSQDGYLLFLSGRHYSATDQWRLPMLSLILEHLCLLSLWGKSSWFSCCSVHYITCITQRIGVFLIKVFILIANNQTVPRQKDPLHDPVMTGGYTTESAKQTYLFHWLNTTTWLSSSVTWPARRELDQYFVYAYALQIILSELVTERDTEKSVGRLHWARCPSKPLSLQSRNAPCSRSFVGTGIVVILRLEQPKRLP